MAFPPPQPTSREHIQNHSSLMLKNFLRQIAKDDQPNIKTLLLVLFTFQETRFYCYQFHILKSNFIFMLTPLAWTVNIIDRNKFPPANLYTMNKPTH